MVVVWQVRRAGTPWPPGPRYTCCVTSPRRAINLRFHKLQAFCVHASHHMWTYFFPFWEVSGRNVVEILQRSTSAGWQEASSVTDRMAKPLDPSRCTYASKRACAAVRAHPASCRARNIAALLNWASAVETLENLCPGGWPGAPRFHCSSHRIQQAVLCVLHFFCIYWYGASESCQIPEGQGSIFQWYLEFYTSA